MAVVKPAAPMSAPPPEPRDEEKRRKPGSFVWRLIAIGFGVSLVLLGVAGLFLPILQGWLMIFAGLAVLSPYSRRARRIMNYLKSKLRIRKADGKERE